MHNNEQSNYQTEQQSQIKDMSSEGDNNSSKNHTGHQDHGDHGNHENHGERSMEQQGHNSHEGHDDHGGHENHHEMMIKDFRTRFYVSIVLTIPVLVFAPLIQNILGYTLTFPGMSIIVAILASILYFYGGVPFFKGMRDEVKKRQLGMMTLVALAITVSYVYSIAVVTVLTEGSSFFWELATLIDVMLLGHWIEMKSVLGASKALESLVKLLPSQVHRYNEDGDLEDIPIGKLRDGDRILVRPAEKIPADGNVIAGKSSVNEAMLTGEAKLVSKEEGESVIGGSINQEGSLTIEVTASGDKSYLSQVIKLVKEAQETRSKAQDLANKAAFVLTLVAIFGGTFTLVTWLLLGKDLGFALERMVTVIVITCPHALGLAVPLVVSVSTSMSAQSGLLIRDRIAFERARKTGAVAFDKTGTLTLGKFGVTEVQAFNGISEEELVATAAAIEVLSQHPIANGIVAYAKDQGIDFKEADEFNSITGKGVEGKINGQVYNIISEKYLREMEIQIPEDVTEQISKLNEQGNTVVFVTKDATLLGLISLGDIIREESKAAVDELRRNGIKSYMITGDSEKVASWVADKIGLDGYYAEVLPHEKSEIIKKIQDEGYITAMVGDGVNDAPALVQADVGIAIGAGTDVAIESADIILTQDNPNDVLKALDLSKKTYRKMQENLVWATGYNAVAIPIAAGIFAGIGVVLNPAVGALFMSLSTVIVAINAMRLKLQD